MLTWLLLKCIFAVLLTQLCVRGKADDSVALRKYTNVY